MRGLCEAPPPRLHPHIGWQTPTPRQLAAALRSRDRRTCVEAWSPSSGHGFCQGMVIRDSGFIRKISWLPSSTSRESQRMNLNSRQLRKTAPAGTIPTTTLLKLRQCTTILTINRLSMMMTRIAVVLKSTQKYTGYVVCLG